MDVIRCDRAIFRVISSLVRGVLAADRGDTAARTAEAAETFGVGEVISYFSKSHENTWILATVTSVGKEGIQINHKPGVWIELGSPSVRKAGGGESFRVGEKVKYFSSSMQDWIVTKIIFAQMFIGVQVAVRPGWIIKPADYTEKLRKMDPSPNRKAAAGKALLNASMGRKLS